MLISLIRTFILSGILLLSGTLVFAETEVNVTPVDAIEDSQDQEIVPENPNSTSKIDDSNISFADLFRKKSKEAYFGVLTGNLLATDSKGRYLFIKPNEANLPRLFIYLDQKTSYTRSKNEIRKKSKLTDFIEGSRVAIRCFVKYGIILADEVYLVEGDFEAKARYSKRKIAKSSAPVEKKTEGEATKETKEPKKEKGGH